MLENDLTNGILKIALVINFFQLNPYLGTMKEPSSQVSKKQISREINNFKSKSHSMLLTG